MYRKWDLGVVTALLYLGKPAISGSIMVVLVVLTS